jgi:hypothetical protein
MRLTSTGADFNIMWETCLFRKLDLGHQARLCKPMKKGVFSGTYPHGGMKRSCNLIVLLQSWATAQDLWEPELADGTFHMLNLALSRWRSLDPLRRFSSNTANHVRMGQSLWSSLTRLNVQRSRKRLRDPRVQRGCSTGNDEVFGLFPRRRSLASARTETERRSHVVDVG